MTRRAKVAGLGGLAGLLLGVACGPWQRIGAPEGPAPGVALPRLFDASAIYRSMGFLVSGGSLPFVASVRYLRGPASDSTLALVSLSLANHALTFQRSGNEFVAQYRVEAAFRVDSGVVVRQIARDEQVRVRSFQETLRIDESVIFQQFVALAPGAYSVAVLVRDRNGPAFGRAEHADTAPAFGRGPRPGLDIAQPIAIYQGSGRTQLSALPTLLANPRATAPYGADTLRFYVEGYDLPADTRLLARAVDRGDTELWRDTIRFSGTGPLATATIAIAPTKLPVGQATLEVMATGGGARADTVTEPFLVSFSSQWVITNFDEMMSLLRYFEEQAWIDSLRKAPPERRSDVWQAFWKATDPVAITPDNEALDDYFHRVQQANARFTDEGQPGWLTDRGEVYISLGEPDEILDLSTGMSQSGVRAIRWTYSTLRLVLYFQDQTGFSRFRLTPASRAEFQRVLARVRRQ